LTRGHNQVEQSPLTDSALTWFDDRKPFIADRIRPRDIAFFHGVLDTKKLSLPEKLIVKGIKAPVGDFRDWGPSPPGPRPSPMH